MASFTEFESYDGLGLAELVKNGEVTPVELVDAAIGPWSAGRDSFEATSRRGTANWCAAIKPPG